MDITKHISACFKNQKEDEYGIRRKCLYLLDVNEYVKTKDEKFKDISEDDLDEAANIIIDCSQKLGHKVIVFDNNKFNTIIINKDISFAFVGKDYEQYI